MRVDERGPSLVGILQNLSEGLAQPRTMDVSDNRQRHQNLKSNVGTVRDSLVHFDMGDIQAS